MVNKENYIKLEILEVKQNIGKFYLGVGKASEVIKICSPNERHKDELQRYMGIQRFLNPKRVIEIKKYVTTSDASFPNSIILALKDDSYFFENNVLYIKKSKESSNIIDGQHRLSGFYEGGGEDFDLILTIFTKLEMEQQAYIFSVINTKMTRINPSLAQDLYDFSTISTPEKVAHNITQKLNSDNNSPLFNKIKILGMKEEGMVEPILSQSTFSKYIIELIADQKSDSYTIRDKLKRNKNDRKSLKDFYPESKKSKYVFWDFYTESQDSLIYKILNNYFHAIYKVFPMEWEDSTKILIKTTGYIALMNIFREIFKIGLENKNFSIEFFEAFLIKAKNSGELEEFIADNYPPGGRGESKLKKNFLKGMNL